MNVIFSLVVSLHIFDDMANYIPARLTAFFNGAVCRASRFAEIL